MLDSETKRRIDSARDILVGKVPDPKSQVEQITLALIYKFMDDMDAEAEELGGERTFFTGEFARYGWAKMLDVSLGAQETLNRYAEALEKMKENQKVPQLFRDIFKNAFLPYRDPETLKSFLKEINGFEYDHSERLGDAFEYLLKVLGTQADAGQFITPRHIIDFMVELVDPQKEDRVLDPACGTAGFLISAYRHIMKRDREEKAEGKGMTPDERTRLMENFEGYDISPDMVRLSLVNLYLHGFTTPKIYEYDTLTSDERWKDFADVIMANPPFMSPKGGIRPHKRFSVESNRSEVLFVDYIAEHLTPNGRAAVIVPEGVIFQSGKAYKALRKMLVEQDYLVGVISLPAGVFNPYSGVKTSILWIDRTLAKKADNIIFCKIESDGFDLGAQRRPNGKNDLPAAINAYKNYKSNLTVRVGFSFEGPNSFTLVKKESLSVGGEYNLSTERYSHRVLRNTNFPMVQLGDLCEIVSGIGFPKEEQGHKEEEIPFLKVSDMNAQGNEREIIYWNNAVSKTTAKRLGAKICPKGTIIFPKIGAAIATNKKRVLSKNGVFDNNIMGLIPGNRILSSYLFDLLIPFNLSKWSSKSALPSMRKSDIEIEKIPLPPLESQQELVAEIESYQKVIDGARMVVENYRPRIEVDPSWPVVKLGDIANFMTGGTPSSSKKEYYENGDIKWLVSGDIHQEEIFDCKGRITQLGFDNSNAKYLPVNSVLIALNGQGKTRGTVALLRVKATCNQSLVSIFPKNEQSVLPEFIYYSVKQKYQEIRNITGDNQRSGLNMPILKNISIQIPEINKQKRIIEQLVNENKIVFSTKLLISIFEEKIRQRVAKVWGE